MGTPSPRWSPPLCSLTSLLPRFAAPSYGLWLSLDPVDPSSPTPTPALTSLIQSLNKGEARSALLPPRIPLLDEFTSAETPSTLLDNLRTAVDEWKEDGLARHQVCVQPLRIEHEGLLMSAALVPLVEENPDYDPDYVVDGLPLVVESVQSFIKNHDDYEGESFVGIALEEGPASKALFAQAYDAFSPRKPLSTNPTFLENLERGSSQAPRKLSFGCPVRRREAYGEECGESRSDDGEEWRDRAEGGGLRGGRDREFGREERLLDAERGRFGVEGGWEGCSCVRGSMVRRSPFRPLRRRLTLLSFLSDTKLSLSNSVTFLCLSWELGPRESQAKRLTSGFLAAESEFFERCALRTSLTTRWLL